MRARTLAAPLALLLLLAPPLAGRAAAAAGEYALDPLRSTLLLRVWKEGSLSAFAHDHVVRAGTFTGTVRYDPVHPQMSSIEVSAETAGLVADEPTYRHRFDMPPVDEGSRHEIQHTMLSDKQLDATAFPTITFKSTRVQAQGAIKVNVTGALTIHGQTREVSFPADVAVVQGLFRGRATFRFRQSDFGITPYSFGNAVRNQDEVELHLELIAAPAPTR